MGSPIITQRDGRKTSGTATATAYGPPWNAMNGTGVTRQGTDLRGGGRRYIIAVDPDVIPLGSNVYVWPNPYEYRGTFLADDIGGAINGGRIDFYVAEGRDKQNAWGRRQVKWSLAGEAGGGVAQGFWEEAGSLVPDPFGIIPGGDVIPDDIVPDPSAIANGVLDATRDAFAFFRKLLLLFYPSTWVRIGKVVLGVALLLYGTNTLMKTMFGINPTRAAIRGTAAIATKGGSEVIGAAVSK